MQKIPEGLQKITGRKITDWDGRGFDKSEEYGPYSKNSKGKRFGYVKAWRKMRNRKFRQRSKNININNLEE